MATARQVSIGVAAACAASACTTLGPMPATTGVTPMPAPRPGVEAQLAVVPGYYLSSAVTSDPHGDAFPAIAGLLDFGAWIDVPGLAIGGRLVAGDPSGGYPELLVAYRRTLDRADQVAVAVVGFGAHAEDEANDANYQADRAGVEVAGDLRASIPNRWFEVHLVASAAATALSAKGTYCIDNAGLFGRDCDNEPLPRAKAEVSGLYPSGRVAVAFDTMRHLDGPAHGARMELGVGVGLMPTVVSGEQVGDQAYGMVSLSVTVGLGESAPAAAP